MAFKDLTGNVYNRLTVVEYSHSQKKHSMWLCRCDCGKETIAYGGHLKTGKIKSCGCLQKEMASVRAKQKIGPKNHRWGIRGAKHPNWGKRGELSKNWRGGKTKHEGYILASDKDHPRADARGYVYEHILVMEKMLGRPLTNGEVVHHCNGDKVDNRPYNLRLFFSPGDHTRFHFKLREDGIRQYGRYRTVRKDVVAEL